MCNEWRLLTLVCRKDFLLSGRIIVPNGAPSSKVDVKTILIKPQTFRSRRFKATLSMLEETSRVQRSQVQTSQVQTSQVLTSTAKTSGIRTANQKRLLASLAQKRVFKSFRSTSLWLIMLLSFCLYLTQRYAVIHIVLFSRCYFNSNISL
jgi:hypothetical protein